MIGLLATRSPSASRFPRVLMPAETPIQTNGGPMAAKCLFEYYISNIISKPTYSF